MAVRSRLINHEVVELLHRLGIHNWKLSDPERAYLHRYVYLATLQAFETLGILVEDQDPLPPQHIIPPPLFDRVPPMPPTVEAKDLLEETGVIKTNGHLRTN